MGARRTLTTEVQSRFAGAMSAQREEGRQYRGRQMKLTFVPAQHPGQLRCVEPDRPTASEIRVCIARGG